jgi:DNA (cytosine-5)-methyltransferase 1
MNICKCCLQLIANIDYNKHILLCDSNIGNLIKQFKIKQYNYIDLFAGTGAFSNCLTNQGFKCVMANDLEKTSKEIYNLNFDNHNFILEDLNDLTNDQIPSHNILCGGFPCQPFSIAGKKLGFDDKRSNVFFKILEIIDNNSPNIIILENVKNLVSHDDKKTFNIILTLLEQRDYYIKYKILDTSKITNIPQHRERIYIVGFKNKRLFNRFNFNFPKTTLSPIKLFLEQNIPDSYYYDDRFKVFKSIKDNIDKHIDNNVVYQYRRHYVRENKSSCCPTLTANMGSGGHNVPLILDDKGIRKLTPRECFNLQGFDKSYILPKISDSRLYKLAGNAVSVPVVQLIIEKITNIL